MENHLINWPILILNNFVKDFHGYFRSHIFNIRLA